MKKVRISLVLLLVAVYTVLCGYTEYFDEAANKVYDNADILSGEEEKNIQEACVEAAKSAKLDIAVVTVTDTKGKTPTAYAEDFYDENGFGYDQGASGILLLIDMGNRKYELSTTGIAIKYFDDDDIEVLKLDIENYLSDDDYVRACLVFAEDVKKHVLEINESDYEDVEDWFESDYTDYKDFYEENKKTILSNPLIDLMIAAVAAGIIVAVMAFGQKAKMTADASTYLNSNELTVHRSMDTYLRTTVTKRKIESSSGGGGSSGGSFHTGSSGRSHGGGGGSF